jgi:hypothetical protein
MKALEMDDREYQSHIDGLSSEPHGDSLGQKP